MNVYTELAAVQRRIAEITGEAATSSSSMPFSEVVAQTSARFERPAYREPPDAPAGRTAVAGLIERSAARWSVDPALVTAIVANESGFRPNAVSAVGAQGLMQLMPQTASALGVSDAFDPAQNIAGGTRYLAGLLGRFHGDVRLAVAAYNAGPGAVERYGGVPPFAETATYVRNVMESYRMYKAAPSSKLATWP